MSFRLDPSLNGYGQQRAKRFYQETLETIRALPGVQSAGYARAAVLTGGVWGDSMLVEGTMGVPLLDGRDFDDRDGSNTNPVCIVNRTFAEHYFPGRRAVAVLASRAA